MRRKIILAAMAAVLVLSIGGTAGARTKLTALPERDETTVRLDNPSGTLIEEERVLTLQKGLNRIDFSWAGVSIDPDSIRLDPLSHPGEVTLLNVSYPPAESALVWEVFSKEAYEERVRISYLLGAIDRLIAYRLTADKQETKVSLRAFAVLRNFSGEDFDKATVVLDHGESFVSGVRHEETKQVLMIDVPDVPIEKVWTFDAEQTPWDPEEVDGNVGIPVSYKLVNSEKGGLGRHALGGGKVRVYQEDGSGGTIVLGEDRTNGAPVGEEIEVNIGDSRDIVVTQRKMHDNKINVRRNNKNQIVLYDTDELIQAEVENFKNTPAVITLVQYIEGQWEMLETNGEYERKDHRTLEYKIQVPANGKKTLVMQYSRKNIRAR